MRKNGNRNGLRLTVMGLSALVALALVPGLAGAAYAAPAGPNSLAASAVTYSSWAYGGQNGSSGSVHAGSTSVTWSTSVGIVVIFNATNTSANTTLVHATRTVVVTVSAQVSGTAGTLTYNYRAVENDVFYANLTDQARVTLSGTGASVAALGLLNASAKAVASLQESAVYHAGGLSGSAFFNATGTARVAVHLTPALGLIPLNLTGVTAWSSSATAFPSATWNLTWLWTTHNWNGTSSSGNGSYPGSWSSMFTLYLYGHVDGRSAMFHDHLARTGVHLGLGSGPFVLYDGFLLVPAAFDFLSGSAHLGSNSLGASSFTSEDLFLGRGPVAARAVTAANATVAASPMMAMATSTSGGPSPAALPSSTGAPGATVWAQPESPSAAATQANCLQFGCAGPASNGALVLLAAVGAVAVTVGTIGILGWRSYARRMTLSTARAAAPTAPGAPPTPASPSPALPSNVGAPSDPPVLGKPPA